LGQAHISINQAELIKIRDDAVRLTGVTQRTPLDEARVRLADVGRVSISREDT
jgi:hypothetical protein